MCLPGLLLSAIHISVPLAPSMRSAVGFIAGIAVFIKRCYTSDVDYYVQVDEVETIEAEHLSANAKGVNA